MYISCLRLDNSIAYQIPFICYFKLRSTLFFHYCNTYAVTNIAIFIKYLFVFDRTTSVDLPYLPESTHYRVIVANEKGEECPPSISVMVQPSRWKEESSSLFSKLERKYIPSSVDLSMYLYNSNSLEYRKNHKLPNIGFVRS